MKKLFLLLFLPAFTWAASSVSLKTFELDGTGSTNTAAATCTELDGTASTKTAAAMCAELELPTRIHPVLLTPQYAKSFLASKPSLEAREAYLSLLCPFTFRALPPKAKTLYFPQGMYAVLDAGSPHDYLVTGALYGCTALVLHNLSTKKVGFAHVDPGSELTSLHPLLSELGFVKTKGRYLGEASKVTIFAYELPSSDPDQSIYKNAFAQTCDLFHEKQNMKKIMQRDLMRREPHVTIGDKDMLFFRGFLTAERTFAVDKDGIVYNTCMIQNDILKMHAYTVPLKNFLALCAAGIVPRGHLQSSGDDLIDLSEGVRKKYAGWASLTDNWKLLFLGYIQSQLTLHAGNVRRSRDGLSFARAAQTWDFPYFVAQTQRAAAGIISS